MPTPVDIAKESTNLAHEAELGTPQSLDNVHKELQKDMKNYSAADYGKLLNGIQSQNQVDLAANDHLPSLSFYDSGSSGVSDSVSAQYADGTVRTANQPIGGHPGAGAGAGGGGGGGDWGNQQPFDQQYNQAPPGSHGNNQHHP